MAREEFGSFGDVLDSVARRKHEAALARQRGAAVGAEKPREVYLDACQRIGTTLVPNRFRYLRSKQQLIRELDHFTHRVTFKSSHSNVSGQHVVLWMYANARCSELQEWRKQQPHALRGDGWVAGGMVHLLEMKHAMLEWELADPRQRSRTIDDAVDFIKSVVLPYLDRFQEPAEVVAAIRLGAIHAFSIGDEIEFALCFAGPEAAQSVLDRFIVERPDLHESIHRAFDRMQRDGLPEFNPSGHADVVAWTHFAYGLTLRSI